MLHGLIESSPRVRIEDLLRAVDHSDANFTPGRLADMSRAPSVCSPAALLAALIAHRASLGIVCACELMLKMQACHRIVAC